jgi:hypothetical protein
VNNAAIAAFLIFKQGVPQEEQHGPQASWHADNHRYQDAGK